MMARPREKMEASLTPTIALSLAARYVKPALFQMMTGYTAKALERKIADKVWLEGHEYKKAPDGNILVDLIGYQRWVESDGHKEE